MSLTKLEDAKGKVIVSIARGDLLIDKIENEDDQGPLELIFSDGFILTLGLIPDGESATFTWNNSVPEKITDQNCEWERIFLTNSQPFSSALNDIVIEVDTLLLGDSESSDSIAGFGLKLEKENTIIYYNEGDFSKIYWNTFPKKLPSPFYLKWKNGRLKKI